MPEIKRRALFFLAMTGIAIFWLVAALIILMTRPAWPSTSPNTGLPTGITCEMVREKVAEHGKLVAWAWALKQGYSREQIKIAARCLR